MMKFDVRIGFATLALVLGSCQGGLDSGTGGMPGMMGPPVAQPGPMSTGEMQGPAIGSNGQASLTVAGSTLAPNEAQFAVGDGPKGVHCPAIQQFGCTVAFNIPPPTPTPSPGASKSTPKPTPTPTATPSPSASSDDNDDSDDPTPSPTPPGTITLQMEPLPQDVPPMTNPDPRALRLTSLMAIRLQSDTDFSLNGSAVVTYVMPQQQVANRSFAIQLYNESAVRGKRSDQYLATYLKSTVGNTSVQFTFTTPRVTVRRGQIWLLALYGMQFPPGMTPTPSPSPSGSASPNPSPTPSSAASP